jgi:hypothetical protein
MGDQVTADMIYQSQIAYGFSPQDTSRMYQMQQAM